MAIPYPEIGDPCTISSGSDRYVFTVETIFRRKKLVVVNGGRLGRETLYWSTVDKRWKVVNGMNRRRVEMGVADPYLDPSF